MAKIALPPELEQARVRVLRAIAPLKAADGSTKAEDKLLFTAKRTEAGRKLPPYYLVYFLLIDILGFRNLGRFEKLAWSVPVDLDGKAYLIEHRKFGVGVFAHDVEGEEENARRVVLLVTKGVKAAQPIFRWMADKAVQDSKLNIRNVGPTLFERYGFFRDRFRVTSKEAELKKAEYNLGRNQRELQIGLYSTRLDRGADLSDYLAIFRLPWVEPSQNANWLALAAIDAFFSWTEHIFIHMAVLQSRITTGDELAKIIGAEWGDKFKCALNIDDKETKRHFDTLVIMRRQLRNFVAHGAFGKDGTAFSFHSQAGAVPVTLDRRQTTQFSLSSELEFDNDEALEAIESFIVHLWSGQRAPARLYIQQSSLPVILPKASDGSYAAAMSSVEDMKQFVDHLEHEFDNAANMDW